jgi:antitoxin ParD1/3/4
LGYRPTKVSRSAAIPFAPVDERYVKGKVRAGFYASETELVKDAVRHMREEEERHKRFLAAVRMGDEQIARGETVAYTKDLLEHMTKNAMARAQKGDTPNPDVTPSVPRRPFQASGV